MNIQTGDWVIITNEDINNISTPCPYKPFKKGDIVKIQAIDGSACRLRDWWYSHTIDETYFKRIQDYFQPGDEMRTEWPDGAACSSIISKWDGDKVWFVEGTYHKLPFDGFIVRNLTKEKKEKEANMPKEKPTHLTVDDLYLTAKTPACPSTRQSFIETFGFKVQLNDPKLKDWIIKKGLEKDVKDNLPDHYAVIFPEWQPKINEIVWVCGRELGLIGRTIKFHQRESYIEIATQFGEERWIPSEIIKPISERPFQVGDYVLSLNSNNIYKVVPNGSDHNNSMICIGAVSEEYRKNFELIISPAIPEVK